MGRETKGHPYNHSTLKFTFTQFYLQTLIFYPSEWYSWKIEKYFDVIREQCQTKNFIIKKIQYEKRKFEGRRRLLEVFVPSNPRASYWKCGDKQEMFCTSEATLLDKDERERIQFVLDQEDIEKLGVIVEKGFFKKTIRFPSLLSLLK